jgi:DNA-directed RNA polymerase II subunit RPB7
MIPGIIEYDSGSVTYQVTYQALLFRPLTNEVLDAVVGVVNALGFFAFVGPLRIFVSKHSMPSDISGLGEPTDNDVGGGSAIGGYDGERSSWISADKVVEIKAGCGVRLKIIGSTVEEGNITGIGSIKDDFLGLVDNGLGGGDDGFQ